MSDYELFTSLPLEDEHDGSLSTSYGSREVTPYFVTRESPIDSHESPSECSPELIIEVEKKPQHDEPKEFYDKLEKSMAKLYKKYILKIDDDTSSRDSIVERYENAYGDERSVEEELEKPDREDTIDENYDAKIGAGEQVNINASPEKEAERDVCVARSSGLSTIPEVSEDVSRISSCEGQKGGEAVSRSYLHVTQEGAEVSINGSTRDEGRASDSLARTTDASIETNVTETPEAMRLRRSSRLSDIIPIKGTIYEDLHDFTPPTQASRMTLVEVAEESNSYENTTSREDVPISPNEDQDVPISPCEDGEVSPVFPISGRAKATPYNPFEERQDTDNENDDTENATDEEGNSNSPDKDTERDVIYRVAMIPGLSPIPEVTEDFSRISLHEGQKDQGTVSRSYLQVTQEGAEVSINGSTRDEGRSSDSLARTTDASKETEVTASPEEMRRQRSSRVSDIIPIKRTIHYEDLHDLTPPTQALKMTLVEADEEFDSFENTTGREDVPVFPNEDQDVPISPCGDGEISPCFPTSGRAKATPYNLTARDVPISPNEDQEVPIPSCEGREISPCFPISGRAKATPYNLTSRDVSITPNEGQDVPIPPCEGREISSCFPISGRAKATPYNLTTRDVPITPNEGQDVPIPPCEGREISPCFPIRERAKTTPYHPTEGRQDDNANDNKNNKKGTDEEGHTGNENVHLLHTTAKKQTIWASPQIFDELQKRGSPYEAPEEAERYAIYGLAKILALSPIPEMREDFTRSSSRERRKRSRSSSSEIQEIARSSSSKIQEIARNSSSEIQEIARSSSSEIQEIARSSSNKIQEIARSSSSGSQEIARSSLSTGQEISRSSSSGGQEIARRSSSGGQEIARSSLSTGQEISRSSSSGGQEIARRSSSGGQEIARSSLSTGQEISRSSSSGGQEKARRSSSGGQEIARSSLSTGQEISRSLSSGGQEIARRSSSGGQEIARSSLSTSQEISRSSSSGDQEIARRSSSGGQEIARSSLSTSQEISRSSSSGDQEIARRSSSGGQEMARSSSSGGLEIARSSSSTGQEIARSSSSVRQEIASRSYSFVGEEGEDVSVNGSTQDEGRASESLAKTSDTSKEADNTTSTDALTPEAVRRRRTSRLTSITPAKKSKYDHFYHFTSPTRESRRAHIESTPGTFDFTVDPEVVPFSPYKGRPGVPSRPTFTPVVTSSPRESPLPELITEVEKRRTADESEEFYKDLERKIVKLYRKYILKDDDIDSDDSAVQKYKACIP